MFENDIQDNAATLLLLIEDNPADAELFKFVMKEADCACNITVCMDGDEALRHLSNADNPLPNLIVCDLNLPKLDGFEIAGRILGQEHLRSVPFIMLTGSARPGDKQRALELGVSRYLTKPQTLEGYAAIAQHVTSICKRLVSPVRRA